MPDGGKWVVEYHPWARPTHDLPNSFLHLRSIAMCRAFLASRLTLTITASVKAAVSIIQQFPTRWAELGMSFALLAIQTYHLLYYYFLILNMYSIHFLCYLCCLENINSPDLTYSLLV